MMSPVGLNVAKFYPAPNYNAVGNNYQAFANNIDNWDSFVAKGDERLSDKDTFSVNFGKRYERKNGPWQGSNLGEFGDGERDDNELGGLTYTHIFSPRLILEARGGLSRNPERQHILANGGSGVPINNFPTAAQLGIQGSTSNPMLAGFPKISVTNYLALGFNDGEPVQLSGIAQNHKEQIFRLTELHRIDLQPLSDQRKPRNPLQDGPDQVKALGDRYCRCREKHAR
jgi:hypothetical protein